MSWKLYLDDCRKPYDETWTVCRSSAEAIAEILQRGLPDEMSLDHDLSGNDTGMVFLGTLFELIPVGWYPPENCFVHSANPVGADTMRDFICSWRDYHRDRYELFLKMTSADVMRFMHLKAANILVSQVWQFV